MSLTFRKKKKKVNKDFKAVCLPSKRMIPHQRIPEKKKSQTRADLGPRMFIVTALFIIAKYFKNLNSTKRRLNNLVHIRVIGKLSSKRK